MIVVYEMEYRHLVKETSIIEMVPYSPAYQEEYKRITKSSVIKKTGR